MEATVKYLSVGRKDCRERLQDSVCISASAFQRRGLHFRETGTSAFVDTGIASSAGQRGHRTCSPARQRVRLLQPVFSGSQERWGVASNFRSSRVEPLPQNIQVQNVDNQDNCVSDPIGGLVCDNRSQGRILSCRYLSTTQEVPEVRFRGEAYQYRVLPFGLALSPRTYTKCMDAALAPLQLQGIRILNYIDDWLILAQSQELALRHRDVFLSHLKSLGLRLNAKKIILSPAQRTTYLGVVWDSITMRAQLSPARVKSILNALNNIKLGQIVTVHYLQRVLGLMAAASMVIPLGLLHMRSFQLWLRARGFHPRANPQRQIRVTRQGLCTLSMWFRAEYGSQIKYPSSTARRGRFQSGEISYLRRRGQYFMSGP